ncbi:MAG: hypothetical protein RL238_106 [Actinomycetota bacterium]
MSARPDVEAERHATERSPWRVVALPSEHGGWGLTLEPVLLGWLVAWSIAGAALGVAGLLAFLVRTPLKLVFIDLRRHQWQQRSRLAAMVASGELVLMAALAVVAVWRSGWAWAVPALIAAPLVAVGFAYDIRSRGRRLVPELCGAIGIAASAAAIVLAAGHGAALAAGAWLVLAARSVGAIPFVRAQIMRLRRGEGPVRQSDAAQFVAVGIAAAAVVATREVVLGVAGVVALGVLQAVAVRRPPIAAKQLGLRQMALGFGLVLLTAVGVWTW